MVETVSFGRDAAMEGGIIEKEELGCVLDLS